MDNYSKCNSGINAYNPLPEFEGLTFEVDSFAGKNADSVMPILFEEQPITWLLFKEKMAESLDDGRNKSVLDVGCGSGFWALIFKKHFPHSTVFTVDKTEKAITYLTKNEQRNGITGIQKKCEGYCRESYDAASFDMIVLNPPYHLYCPENEEGIPYFAANGGNGYFEFYRQLAIVQYHLRNDGMILFHQMCLGGEEPAYVEKVKELFPKGSLEYYNILEPLASKDFLDSLYSDAEISKQMKEWKNGLKKKFSSIFYTSGIIHKQEQDSGFVVTSKICDWKNGEIEKRIRNTRYFTREPTWRDRIDLHRDINTFKQPKIGDQK